MLLCQHNSNPTQTQTNSDLNCDWSLPALVYPNVEELPSFIAQHRQRFNQCPFTTTANPNNLQNKQLQVYTIVSEHHQSQSLTPLHMTVSGTAGHTLFNA